MSPIMKFLLHLSSFSIVLLFYFIVNKIDIVFITNDFLKYISLISLALFFSWSVIILIDIKYYPYEITSVKCIEPVYFASNNIHILLGISTFFIGGSINIETILILSILFILLWLCNDIYYFNPLFILLGYNYYFVTSKKGVKILIISKQKYKIIKYFDSLIRINDYTFLEKDDSSIFNRYNHKVAIEKEKRTQRIVNDAHRIYRNSQKNKKGG